MKRKIIVIMILTFLIISLSQTCFVKAQSTPYSVSEKLTANTSGWHNVSSIKQGDPVFISIPSTRGISSALYYPNLTLASSVANTLSTVYQLSAQIAGTYILRIDSGLDNNYTIYSSHPVTTQNQSTPFTFNDTITANTAKWYNFSEIKQSDLVLVSIPSTRGISSSFYYPNITTPVSSVGNTLSTDYQFSAQVPGTYVLRIDSGLDNNYTIHASHPVVPEFPMGFVPLMIVLGFVVIFFKKSGWVNSKL